MAKINKIYEPSGKCDDQQKYKANIEAAMVSTLEGCTGNIPMTPNPYVSSKAPSTRKTTLPIFRNIGCQT